MALRKGTRIGGRGCPTCGSHDTEGIGKGGVQWCHACNHRWQPCAPGCRGYRLDIRATDGPAIIGCSECGVPDTTARRWPEAWRAMAHRLTADKMEQLE